VSAAYTKVKYAFQTFGTIRIKSPFVENYKECTICAILRENTLFCVAAKRLKHPAQYCAEAQK